MSRLRVAVAVVASCAAAAAAGCGFGEGETTEGEATLTVTRDYGAQDVLQATVSDPPESETVIRFLDREADITTRFGGGFVHSINGVAGQIANGRQLDWFFFVNGIESPVGSADVTVRAGDRIWWDYRDWTDALRTPAVVGSWPEPFAQASAGDDGLPVRVECAGERAPCEDVAARLAEEGIEASIATLGSASGGDALRVIVGVWPAVREDPLAAQLSEGPATSGVFAQLRGSAQETELVTLGERAQEVDAHADGAGLVAGLRRGEDEPAWVLTATDAVGLSEAIEMLDEDSLAGRYAVAVADGVEIPLPVRTGE